MSMKSLLHGIDNNIWKDCRVTHEHLKMAHDVFGENGDLFIETAQTKYLITWRIQNQQVYQWSY